ncbi:MAG: hypothetical protein DWQ34_01765 [Planctomycetota bacterium]|nr:MAG: hypothetical protein DWQ29_04305 [Planctomycetota bacterium]REJ97632.1 MAG: hypothetical protein DWQ34_01765 [Planctomycetota bacterium]REK22176.1 MAG: hypothetical protein DWQ41_19740 [Planctomycetota bacterium]REK35125.1 MAG: hypothetical protein DWQ45_12275 [Planctomycetota bacterium]
MRHSRIGLCPLFALVSIAVHPAVAAEPDVTVEITAADRAHGPGPIAFEVPESLRDAAHVVLTDGKTESPVQLLPDETGRAVFLLSEPLAKGETRTLSLRAVQKPESNDPPLAECIADEESVRIMAGGRPVMQYNARVVMPPEGIDPVYRSSGHLHPVWTPAGRIVTDDFPADHPHQHGIFNAWTKTSFEGRAINFWDQNGKTARVDHAHLEGTVSGDVFAQFTAVLQHTDLTGPDGPQPVLEETRTVRVYPLRERFLFEIETRQKCVADSPLVIHEYHYGGMAYRGPESWIGRPEHDFLTSEGQTRADGNHTRPAWVCVHGPIDGEVCSLAAFGNADNFRHPQPVRLHPSKPYFVFTPAVLGEFEIGPDQPPYVARYRYVVHDGPPDAELYTTLAADYADPPTVRVLD